MAIQLSDDGTMDTVLCCSECGEEFRYNFDGETDDEDTDPEKAYEAFVETSIEDATESHECEGLPACAASIGCLCAGHARGNSASQPCDTRE